MAQIPFMRFEDVPEELVDDAVDAWHEMPRPLALDHQMRFILAAVLPTYRKMIILEKFPEKSMDRMSIENFRIIDETFGEVLDRLANIEKVLMEHLEKHRSIVRDGLGVSPEQFAALFAGDEPIDPEKFRSDLDGHGD